MSGIKLAIRIPWCGDIRRQDICAIGKIADDAGFHSGWLGDHVVYPLTTRSSNPSVRGGVYPPEIMAMPTYEALTLLSFAAAATTRIKLGVGCCVLPQRQPLLVAKEVVTIDRLSEGRVIFGAVGGWLEEEFAALGAPFEHRRSRLEEGVELMRQCWETEHPAWNGEHWRFPHLQFQPKPLQRPLPVWFGGYSQSSLWRAARLGDGWCGSGQAPYAIGSVVTALRHYRRESPRRESPFTIMVSYLSNPNDAEYSLSGSKIRDLMAAHEASGVDVLLLDSTLRDSRAVVALADMAAAAQ